MRKRQNQVALFVIVAITTFCVVVVWPGNPDKYLPKFIPWPGGHGLNLAGFDRDSFRLGLDLAGGASITLEATGDAEAVRAGESLEDFSRRTGYTLDTLLELNDPLTSLTPEEYLQPLPVAIQRIIVPLSLSGADLTEAVEQSRQIMEDRVNGFGISEAEVTTLGGDRINVQVPGVTTAEASQLVGSVAKLEFREQDPLQPFALPPPDPALVRNSVEDAFNPIFLRPNLGLQPRLGTFPVAAADEDVIHLGGARWIPAIGRDRAGQARALSGEFLIRDSIQRTIDNSGLPALAFRLNSDGARLFEQITGRLVTSQAPLAIFLDGQLISAPRVSAVISDSGVITGLTPDDATALRRQLRAGSLPLNFAIIQTTEVAASLGEDSVVQTFQAGLVALLAILLFLVLYYRLPGLLAALALIVYAAVVLATFKLVPLTLTLPGIAGFVLSLALAVDGNVLIFERMREELRLRRSLQRAIDTGFSRAWPAIRDTHVSTLISVVILWFFGDQFNANLIKSFAIALFVGTLFSFSTSIFVTRTFLQLLIGFTPVRNLWLYGVRISPAVAAAPTPATHPPPSPAGGSGGGA